MKVFVTAPGGVAATLVAAVVATVIAAVVATVIAAVTATLVPNAAAQPAASPVGLWRTIDDSDGKPRALVRIDEVDGRLRGRIEKIFPAPGEDTDPRCDKCDGERKGQRIVGMVIVWGHVKEPGADQLAPRWSGGSILDPDNGKVYTSRIDVIDAGTRLRVRGYIGVPVLGRTQEWLREP